MQHFATRPVNAKQLSIEQRIKLGRALELHRLDNITSAEYEYRSLLRSGALIPEVYSNLAAILLDKSEPNSAYALLKQALKRSESHPDTNANLAACLGQLQRWEECLLASKAASRLNPSNPTPHLWAARALLELQGHEQAIELLLNRLSQREIEQKETLYSELILIYLAADNARAALRMTLTGLKAYPQSTEVFNAGLQAATKSTKLRLLSSLLQTALQNKVVSTRSHYHLAKLFLIQEKEDEAIINLLKTVAEHPNDALSWRELGLILKKQKNFEKAAACLRRATKEMPHDRQNWSDLINLLRDKRDFNAALQEAEKAGRLFPKDTLILLDTAYTLSAAGENDRAVKTVKHFCEKNKSHQTNDEILNCLGLLYMEMRMFKDAVTHYRKGLRAAPSNTGIWNNMGMAYGLHGNYKAEVLSYRNAIRHAPDDQGSHMHLAMALLAQDKYREGLREYEWRLKPSSTLHATIKGSMITTKEELHSTNELLVCTEQGLGDVIHFSRFLHDLHHQYPSLTIKVVCPEKLIELLSYSFPFCSDFVAAETARVDDGCCRYIPLMSIPYLLGINPRDSCSPRPYLHIPPKQQKRIRVELRQAARENTSCLIALNWRGNPETEKTNLAGRSMSLEALGLACDLLPEAELISVQKGHGQEDLEDCSFRNRFIACQEAISSDWSFVNTAGYLLACDHVVTTDTCTAHLAGAIGARTHLLLSAPSEWRWRNDTGTSSWYPSMTIYRQRESGRWHEPVSAACEAIASSSVRR